MAKADGLAILAALQGFTQGIAHGLENKRKMDLAERELDMREEETQANRELRAGEILSKAMERDETRQYRERALKATADDRAAKNLNYEGRTRVFEKSVNQKAKQQNQKYGEAAEREDDKFYKTLGTDLRGYNKNILDVQRKITELEETKLRMTPEEQGPYQKLIDNYQGQLQGLVQERDEVKGEMDALLQKRSNPEVKGAVKDLVNNGRVAPPEANALVSAAKSAKSRAELQGVFTKMQALPNYPGKDKVIDLIKDRMRELNSAGSY